MNKNLTEGKPERVLWAFCLPLFASIIFQQLYNIADSFVAGRFIGEEALAAVGNSYEITLIFIAFSFGCNIGCSVIVSSYYGAGSYKDMKTAISTAIISSAALCALLMAIGLIAAGPALRLINTPQSILKDSKLYLDIYIWGLPFVFFYNISNGIFSAMGDSKTPFIFLAISSTANIAVDIIFVSCFRMGVAGVAWATFICQGVSCILALAVVSKKLQRIKCNEHHQLFSLRILKKISVISIASTLQSCFISFGNIVIQALINSFGSGVIAGYSASIKLNNLVITSFTTLGNGISNYTAQNAGAGKYDRIKEGLRAGIKMVWLISIPFVILYFFFNKILLGFFITAPTPTAMKTGVEILRILSPFYFVISAKIVADGILRGVGNMKSFMIATFTDLLLRVLLAFIFSSFLGSVGIWLSWPIGWSVATAISLYFVKKQRLGETLIAKEL